MSAKPTIANGEGAGVIAKAPLMRHLDIVPA